MSMPYTLMLIITALVIFGGYFLFVHQWLKGFLIGLLGLSSLGLASLLSIMSYQALQYRYLEPEGPIGTISFTRDTGSLYTVTLSFLDGVETNFALQGSHWQVSSQILEWSAIWSFINPTPGIRIESVNGLEYKVGSIVEDERVRISDTAETITIGRGDSTNSVGNKVVDENSNPAGHSDEALPLVKTSHYSVRGDGSGPSLGDSNGLGEVDIFIEWLVNAQIRDSQPLLMVDGALFSLGFAGDRVGIKPLNDRALMVFDAEADARESAVQNKNVQ